MGPPTSSELDLHREWSAGRLPSPYPSQIGNARRSFDELIIIQLLELTLPGCTITPQARFGRKYVDIQVTYQSITKSIEFVGPSHFIPQYRREIGSPLDRKAEVEDFSVTNASSGLTGSSAAAETSSQSTPLPPAARRYGQRLVHQSPFR